MPSAASRCTYCTPQPSVHFSKSRIRKSLPRQSVLLAMASRSTSSYAIVTVAAFDVPADLRFLSTFLPPLGSSSAGAGSAVAAAALCSRTSASACERRSISARKPSSRWRRSLSYALTSADAASLPMGMGWPRLDAAVACTTWPNL